MATPKGMRAIQLPVNATDDIHVYSDERHIWLQLRRSVPTGSDIGRSSFKIAFCLTPGTANKLSTELRTLAERNQAKQKVKNVATKAMPPKRTSPSAQPQPKSRPVTAEKK